MEPYVLGLSHHTSPIALRERVVFQEEEALSFLEASLTHLSEGVLVSTCNRTEVYFTCEDPFLARERLIELLARKGDMPATELARHLFYKEGGAAAHHLFRVASGLDALVVGETQVISQVKHAYESARRAGLASRALGPLFQQALSVAKKVQTETNVGQTAVSVGYAATELARKVLGSLEGTSLLLIGAGELAELCLVNMKAAGAKNLIVTNRTFAHAEALAKEIGGKAIPFTDVGQVLADVDIVVGSTGAPHAILDVDTIARSMGARKGRPLFLFDMAVPRDFEDEAGSLAGVHLYDIDSLRAVVDENMEERRRAAQIGDALAKEATQAFLSRQQSRRAVPLIRSLRQKAEEIRRGEMDKALRRLPDLPPRDKEILEAMSALIVKKLLNDPTVALKEIAAKGEADLYLRTTAKLFNLELQTTDEAGDLSSRAEEA